jgi:hypothetical protein
VREGVSGRPETAPEWSQLVDRTVLAGKELTRLALDDPMRHHVSFSPAVVGRCEKKLLPWEAVASVEAAWWLDDDRVAADPEEEALDGSGDGLKPRELGMWSVQQAAWLSRATLEGHTGTIHPLSGYLLALFGHPKLIDPASGQVVEQWPELSTGRQKSSILAEGPAARGGSRSRAPKGVQKGLRDGRRAPSPIVQCLYGTCYVATTGFTSDARAVDRARRVVRGRDVLRICSGRP